MATSKKTPQKTRTSVTPTVIDEKPPKRKGIHAKRGDSQLKTSKNYKKPYRGQGKRR